MVKDLLTEEELSMCLYCIDCVEIDQDEFNKGFQTFFITLRDRLNKENPNLSELEVGEETIRIMNEGFNQLDPDYKWDMIRCFDTMEDYYRASVDYRK